jgi:hypothetical protein
VLRHVPLKGQIQVRSLSLRQINKRKGRASLLAATTVAVAVTSLWASSALASPSASVQEAITLGVRSLTVSPNSISTCASATPLTFPNGGCMSSPTTITNGPVGDHIGVNGAPAVPSDGAGPSWSLCSGSCSGPGSGNSELPGIDQYLEMTIPASKEGFFGPALDDGLLCDTAVDSDSSTPDCYASPGQASTEAVWLYSGPFSSTDQSPIFTTTVTWTAVP